MASSTTVKTFKYDATQQPILSVIEAPLKYRSFARSSQIDLSFSSYIKQEQSTDHGALDDSEITVFDAQKYFSESNDPKESKGVLSPSSNLKHMAAEPVDSASRLSSVSSSVDGYNRNFRVRSFHATPTASSEASWNSQTGLLANPPGSTPISLRNPSAHLDKKRSGSSSATAKWLYFYRRCPCSGKKSVLVEKVISENKEVNTKSQINTKVNSHQRSNSQRSNDQMAANLSNMYQEISSKTIELPQTHQKLASNSVKLQPKNHVIMPNAVRVSAQAARPFSDDAGSVGGFSFPILNNNTSHTAARPGSNMRPKTSISSPLEEPPRESLEVFQPPENSNLRKSIEEDACSDASSDLFEIESFSTQTTSNYPIYRMRSNSLDDAPTLNARLETTYGRRSSLDEPMTPRTEFYAPSEVSIDWSVTTAEGFDKASVTNFSTTASEIGDFTTFGHRSSMEKNAEEAAWNSNCSHGKKKLGNGLLSCRHEKAVNVGPHPLKCLQEGPSLQLGSTSGHVSIANRPPKPSVPPASSRSHPARLSLAFAA